MNIKQLQILDAVVRFGSYRKAAAHLRCSQSTITFQLKNLENSLGCFLFEKAGRHMVLTPAGRTALKEAQKILASHSVLMNLKGSKSSLTGRLRVGVNETLLEFMLIDVIKEFRLLAPEVFFEVEILDAYRLRSKVKDSGVDIGITFNMGDYPPPLIPLPLTACPLGLFASPTLEISESCFFLPGSVPELSVIAASVKSGPYGFFKRFLDRRGIRLGKTMQVGNMHIVKALLESGLGVSYMPKACVEKELAEGSLVEVPTGLGKIDLGLLLLKNANKEESAAASLLSKMIRTKLLDPNKNDGFFRTNLPDEAQVRIKENARKSFDYRAESGGGTGIRTLDLRIKSPLLYQLSYTPIIGGLCRTRTCDQWIKSPLLYQLS